MSEHKQKPKRPVPSYLENFAERKVAAAAAIEQHGLRLQHIKNHNIPYGGVTVVYQHKDHQSFISVSTAVCSENDMFNCSIGRVLAVENFIAGKTITLPFKNQKDGSLNFHIQNIFAASLLGRYYTDEEKLYIINAGE